MKRSERFLMTVVVVIDLLAAVQMTFLMLTERTRARRLSQVTPLQSITEYDRLIRESSGIPGETKPQKSADETGTPLLPDDALDIIAGYDRLVRSHRHDT